MTGMNADVEQTLFRADYVSQCRPDMNMARLHRSSRRLHLADFDSDVSITAFEPALAALAFRKATSAA